MLLQLTAAKFRHCLISWYVPVGIRHPREMEPNRILVLIVLQAVALWTRSDAESNGTVSAAGFGYELTVTGLDAVNYK